MIGIFVIFHFYEWLGDIFRYIITDMIKVMGSVTRKTAQLRRYQYFFGLFLNFAFVHAFKCKWSFIYRYSLPHCFPNNIRRSVCNFVYKVYFYTSLCTDMYISKWLFPKCNRALKRVSFYAERKASASRKRVAHICAGHVASTSSERLVHGNCAIQTNLSCRRRCRWTEHIDWWAAVRTTHRIRTNTHTQTLYE